MTMKGDYQYWEAVRDTRSDQMFKLRSDIARLKNDIDYWGKWWHGGLRGYKANENTCLDIMERMQISNIRVAECTRQLEDRRRMLEKCQRQYEDAITRLFWWQGARA